MANLGTPVTIEFKAFAEMGTLDESGRKNASSDARSLIKKHILSWPSTPKISQSIEVNYSTWELQHTNYQPVAFGWAKWFANATNCTGHYSVYDFLGFARNWKNYFGADYCKAKPASVL